MTAPDRLVLVRAILVAASIVLLGGYAAIGIGITLPGPDEP